MTWIQNIPRLRFPEFIGEWEIKNGELVFESISNKNHNSDLPILAITQEFGAIPRNEIEYNISVTSKSIESYKVVENGDFIISLRSFQGGIEFSNFKGICSPAYIILRPIKDIDRIFFKYYFKTARYIKHLTKNLEGIRDGKMISFKYFSDAKLTFPSLSEQTKIASFCTAIDQKLTLLKKKKSLLEQYKKGVMQRIFCLNCDSSDYYDDNDFENHNLESKQSYKSKKSQFRQLRFKDDNGNEFPEWENKKFGEIYSFKPTNSFSRENLNFENGEIKNIHYGDIHTKFRSRFDIQKENVPYINPEILNKTSDSNYCQEGDLIIADASEDYDDVGKSIELVNLNKQKVVSGLHTIHARPDLLLMHIGFGGIMMKSFDVRKQIKILAQGIKVLSISQNRLSEINLELPSISEQIKIANFLTAIDDKINHCQQQIEKTELWKKGLMQKMFC